MAPLRKRNADGTWPPYPWERARGCVTAVPETEEVERFDGESLRRCPSRLVPDWCWDWLILYRNYDRGVLPEAGGLLDQGAAFVDAMTVIDGQVAELRERERLRAEAEAARNATKG